MIPLCGNALCLNQQPGCRFIQFRKEKIMNKPRYRLLSFMIVLALSFGWYSHAVALTATGQAMLTSTTYYVSTSGNDNNSGSGNAPFKTFARAVSVLQAGDTLQVVPGTYGETLALSKSGTQDAPITVVGNGALLDMRGINPNGIVAGGDYIHISGFEITGAVDFGIHVTGRNVVVENNILHDNVIKNGVGTCGISTSWGSALKVRIGGENTTIRNNIVHDNCGEGIAVTRGVTALVENNTVYDNFSVNIYIDNSPFVTVQNNTSYCTGTHLRNGNRPTGIALGEEFYSGWGARLHDILISGNTISDCRTGIAAFESNVGGTLTNVAILNNYIPSGEHRSISLQTLTNQNVLVANNLIFNSIYVYQSTGVTLGNNTIGNVVPTATDQVIPTNTLVVPSQTPTSIPPSPTNTALPTLIPPTVTQTAVPSTVTATLEPGLPTFTATTVPASPTFTSTSTPPTATSVITNPAPADTVFDDKDARFFYSSGWRDTARKAAIGGSLKLTSLNGSFVTFPFRGQSFSVLYQSGRSFRDMDVYVDGILVGTIHQKDNRSAFQVRWDYHGQLSPGSHVLKLVFVTQNKSGKTNGSIDAVIVR
jgi:parallel beta-helix repeat protein